MTIPETNKPPWDKSDIEDAFSRHDGWKLKKPSDPSRMVRYFRKLILWAANMYESIANAVNENSKHYLGDHSGYT